MTIEPGLKISAITIIRELGSIVLGSNRYPERVWECQCGHCGKSFKRHQRQLASQYGRWSRDRTVFVGCSECSYQRKLGQMRAYSAADKKRRGIRRYTQFDAHRLVTDPMRKPVPICPKCTNLPHERPPVGLCACGRPRYREVIKAVATIGSSAGACLGGVGHG